MIPVRKLRTVQIISKAGPVTINKSDFDPKVHKMFSGELVEQSNEPPVHPDDADKRPKRKKGK